MDVLWMIPVGKEVLKKLPEIASGWDRFLTKLIGAKSNIGIVGQGGIGKSVLLDHISGKAYKDGYKVPHKSRKEENAAAKSDGNRLALRVAPGQGGPKLDTYDCLFDDKKPVDGVIFVAGNGFVTLRNSEAISVNIEKGYDTVSKWRELQAEAELDSLKELIATLRQTKRKNRKPSWLLVVCTKIDLAYSEIEDIENYYSPHGNSAFSNLLNEFQNDVGKDNFEWDSVPVCSQLDDFHWNGEIIKSKLDAEQRDHYIAQMVERMGELCRK